MSKIKSMTIWSRYILTHEACSHYLVLPGDDGLSQLEVDAAALRRDMWPTSGTGLMAERIDNITRGLVTEGSRTDAYPEGL